MDAVSVGGINRKNLHDRDGGSAKAIVVEELEGFMKVYKDGSVERFSHIVPTVHASEDDDESVASKDFVLDSRSGVWARFYLPRKSATGRLPLLIYFHGGGFVLGSPAWSIYHVFMCRLAAESNSIIISVCYRLAPEHRLPVAYDDCFSAVEWVRQQAVSRSSSQVQWLKSHADLSRCFLAGDSAGGNITHHVTMRCGEKNLKPLQIRGAILIQPFFGGEIQSKWERETSDPDLSHRWIDVFWKLSLPVGAKRDHPACNPLMKSLHNVSIPPFLICISERDVLKQRNLDYCDALRRAGKKHRYVIFKDVGHAFQVLSPHSPRIAELTKTIHDFINNGNP